MRALALDRHAPVESAPLRLRELPPPEPGPDEVRLRVSCCGLCHTDLHVIEGELANAALPLILGHQIVGTIDRLGAGVSTLKRGERVGIAWLRWTDGVCRYCRAGSENLCPNARFTGYQADGGYAEYAIAPADYVYRLPEEIAPARLAPLLCAGIIGFRALRLSGAADGDTLGLYGFGGSAHLTLQVALREGCRVFVFTRSAAHRRLALELGAAWAGEADATAPDLLDAGIIFAPAGTLVPAALQQLRPGGTLALAGIRMSSIPRLDYHLLYQERVLRSVANNTRQDARDFLRYAAESPLQTEVEIFSLAEGNQALLALKQSRLRAAAVLCLD